MRFLTRAWSNGDCSDEESDAAVAAYRTHRAAVLPQLPPAVREFAEAVDIHDGLLRSATLDHPARTLRLELRCGDRQQGYFDLALTYLDVRLEKLDVPVLRVIATDARPEALYIEEDLVDSGWYVHRWLWWPFYRELDIHFGRLEFRRAATPDRSFDAAATPFVEIREAAV